jgi:hypothetical protein
VRVSKGGQRQGRLPTTARGLPHAIETHRFAMLLRVRWCGSLADARRPRPQLRMNPSSSRDAQSIVFSTASPL